MIAAHVAGLPIEETLLAALPVLGIVTTAIGARIAGLRSTRRR